MSKGHCLIPSSLGLDNFPSYRPGQEDIIWSLASSTNRFTGLNAPTGTGKSIISISAGKVLGGRILYLVVTKNLSSQLMNDFASSGLYSINGHVNFECASRSSYDDSDEMEVECVRGEQCLYNETCIESLSHNMVVTNYAHWVTLAKNGMTDRLGHFDTVILDEAHNILNKLTDFLTLTFNARSLSRYLKVAFPSSQMSLEKWIEWAKELIPIARQQYRSLTESKADKRDIRRVQNIGVALKKLVNDKSDWIVKQERADRVSFIPLNITGYSEQYLFRGIQRAILVSGTLFKDDLNDIGVTSNFDYMDIPSPFPVVNRPIIYFPSSPPVRVSHKMDRSQKVVWMNHVDRISNYELSLGNKGIIQTRSYNRSIEMISLSKLDNDLIMTHNREDTTPTIAKFKSIINPMVLFSPSIEEGVDFPHDQCRFQIIPKIPFLDPNDLVTKARLAKDKTFGEREAARTIIQQAGRIVRGPGDYGRTYITDSHWEWFRRKSYFFRWFRLAFKTVYNLSDIPKQ